MHTMRLSVDRNFPKLLCILRAMVWACLCAPFFVAAQRPTVKKTPAASTTPASGAWRFASPQQAVDVLVDAAAKFDVVALARIFGSAGEDVVFSGEFAQDRQHAANFSAEAREKKVFLWIRRRGTARSSSWATRTGRSP